MISANSCVDCAMGCDSLGMLQNIGNIYVPSLSLLFDMVSKVGFEPTSPKRLRDYASYLLRGLARELGHVSKDVIKYMADNNIITWSCNFGQAKGQL